LKTFRFMLVGTIFAAIWSARSTLKGLIVKNTLVFAFLVFSMAATTANAIPMTINATDSGWWDDTPFSTDESYSNYIAGEWIYDPAEHNDTGDPYDVVTRNFVVFDLSGVGPNVTSATLRLRTNWNQQFGTFSLFSVESTIPCLRRDTSYNPPTPCIDQFIDLGDGNSYGSIGSIPTLPIGGPVTPGYVVEIELTGAALASINAQDGCASTQDCLWAIGGTFTTDNPDANYGFMFGASGLGERQLVYTAPTPATLALFGLGLAGLGWSRRKKA